MITIRHQKSRIWGPPVEPFDLRNSKMSQSLRHLNVFLILKKSCMYLVQLKMKKKQTKSNQNASLCIGRAEQPRRNNNAQNSGGGGAQRQRPDADLSAVPRAISPGIVLFFML